MLSSLCNACADENEDYVWKTKEVDVTAYNSVYWQTDDEPGVAAWGDTLIPWYENHSGIARFIAFGYRSRHTS
ncbi:hypothetical protein [Zobellia laminariae]|uniref:hypothetical protein n=1 Tax=Zobellia laminariae TaxID=248906 RepID=UPI0026F473A9|nr:hypothetical protein [Zobellia laminariae]WKX76036.1 hypothetical protein Q5W13_21020 [Zobellia laminariae]